MNRDQDPKQPPDIDDAALQWFTRLRGGLSAVDRAAFEQWVAASPSHRQAFRRAQSLWSAAESPGERVAQEEAVALGTYLETMDRSKAKRKRRTRGITAIIVGLAVVGAVAIERPNLLQDLRADAVSVPGERRNVELPDGSAVLLDADTALAKHFTNGERRIVLLRGAAFFSVVKADHPFVVEASTGVIQVVGTKFDVRLTDDGALITVAQGRVSVRNGDASQPAVLDPGQEVRLRKTGLGAIHRVDLNDSMAWHEGRFVFYQARFADVVRELQRYRSDRLVIASSALAESRVSGSFILDDADAALESLRSTVHFETYGFLGRLTVLR